jgi:GntR family transcriptional repressor for pyruvate dehydrogenase complex
MIVDDTIGDHAPAGEDLAARIGELIGVGTLAAGSRLPSERDLAEMLGVSRPIVSQAVRILVVRGLVESRRGSGTYVMSGPAEASRLILDLNDRDVAQMAEFRLWLETTGLVQAVDRATPDEVVRGEDALERLKQSAGDTASWMSADTLFHATLVDAAHNPYLSAVYRSVHIAVINCEYQGWMSSGEVPSWLHESEAAALHALHEPILQAIKHRDARAARRAVVRHHNAMSRHLAAAGS